jgi:FkbM family methyltransferase
MKFISYAQNFEDVILWRALKHVKNGFYIDVGAAWPDKHSVTKAFYDEGWQGINIEPNPLHHALLVDQRPRDTNLQLAIGANSAQMAMSLIGSTGLSTLDAYIADKHQQGGWVVEEQQVNVEPLRSVCQLHLPAGQAIHFMKVDVEGFEKLALESNDWTVFRPWVVLVEATQPMTQTESYGDWEPILLNAAYRYAYADGLNRFYVANEHAELLAAFKYPPNVFDGFLLSSQQESESKAQQAESKAQQAEFKAQQAESKAQQAESKAQQAESKAQQAESKAQQAESKAQQSLTATVQHMAQLQAVYASKSWLVTAPLRWISTQAKCLRTEGITSRVKAFVKKALRKINQELLLRPALRKRVLHLIYNLGLYDQLKLLMTEALGGEQRAYSITQDFMKRPIDFQNLSPRARDIYLELKQAIEKKREKH